MSAEPEASVEDILASIRKIIAEDDAREAREASQQAQPEDDEPDWDEDASGDAGASSSFTDTAPPVEPALERGGGSTRPPLPKSTGTVLTLTRMVREDGSIEELSGTAPQPSFQTEPANDAGEQPEYPAAEEAAPVEASMPDPALVGSDAAQSVTISFDALEAAMAEHLGGRTDNLRVEEIARPLIKNWLDANLPDLVERVVREEVERLARRR